MKGFKLRNETTWRDDYLYLYDYDSTIKEMDILKSIEKRHKISRISLMEDADLGFKTIGGSYSLEEFHNAFDDKNLYVDRIIIYVENPDVSVLVKMYDNEIMLSSNEKIKAKIEDVLTESDW